MAETPRGLTLRAFLIATSLTVLCGLWVRQAEIVVVASQVTESVPPIPAVAVLLGLVALNPLLRRMSGRLALSRAELLSIYCFVAIAISMLGPGALRFWLSCVSAPFYFATPENHLASLYSSIPGWLAVKDTRLIKQLYEGSRSGGVPWRAWAVPLAAWGAFFMALWSCMLCLMRIVQHRWMDAERLTFPIVKLPIETTAEGDGSTPFLRNPVMWGGFALAALYNFLNIFHAILPTVPAPGKSFELNPFLSAEPWISLQPLTLHYRPELIGFGFLVPSEILFSIWFFYLLTRLEGLVAHLFAWDVPGMPFDQEQSIGAYLLLGVWLLWTVRADWIGPVREWLVRSHNRITRTQMIVQPEGQVAGLLPVVGFAVSFLFLCVFCMAAGMKGWVAVAYLGVALLVALVCARIRAEAGIPLIWLFPFFQQKKILLYTFGTGAFLDRGGMTTLTMFAMLTFLARGYFPALIGYQIESLKIAEEVKVGRRSMCQLILVAALVGLAVAYYFPLATYYHFGSQHLGGMWGWDMPVQEYTAALAAQTTPHPPDPFRTAASASGALIAGLLILLRRSFVGFPLHPLGYAVATAYGSLVWWSFFLVWGIKGAILKWGGMGLYRKAIPFFLGFALGHFFAAGMVWGLLGSFWPDAARAYGVWFG